MNCITFKSVFTKLAIASFAFVISLTLSSTNVKADSDNEVIKTVATYNYRDVSPEEMTIIDNIVTNDNTITKQIIN